MSGDGDPDCLPEDITISRLSGICFEKQNCSIEASDDLYHNDMCNGDRYLEYTYTCYPGNIYLMVIFILVRKLKESLAFKNLTYESNTILSF